MGGDREELIADVFCQVLEKFAFMFGETCEKEELIIEEDRYLQATINFHGFISGVFGIASPVSLCVDLAANILGIDPDDQMASEDGGDALKELLNVICGQILTRIFGEETIFNLSVPTLQEMDRDAWRDLIDEPETIGLLLDDIPMAVNLHYGNSEK